MGTDDKRGDGREQKPVIKKEFKKEKSWKRNASKRCRPRHQRREAHWTTTYRNKNLLMLMEALQTSTFYYKASQDALFQSLGQSVLDYYECFKSMMEIMVSLDLRVHDDEGILEAVAVDHGEDVASLFATKVDEYRCSSSWTQTIVFMKMRGRRNSYPPTLHDANTFLQGYNPKKAAMVAGDKQKLGITFVNNGNGKKYDGPECGRCGYQHATKACCATRHFAGTMLHVEEFYKDKEISSDDDENNSSSSCPSILQKNASKSSSDESSSDCSLDSSLTEQFDRRFYHGSSGEHLEGEAFGTLGSEDSDQVSKMVLCLESSDETTQFMFLNRDERRLKLLVGFFSTVSQLSMYSPIQSC
jgi:hypothetical protein